MKRRYFAQAAAVAIAAVLTAAGCSAGGTNVGGGDQPKATQNKLTLDPDGKQSSGPAAEVPGAQPGGTLNLTWRTDFPDYDPARIYTAPDEEAFRVMNRRLTILKQNDDGTMALVGDLATNTGVPSDGGKTWKYTLKDGLKYADGTPIKSQDIKYAVERTFDTRFATGPQWVQLWLAGKDDFQSVYPGPYGGRELGSDKIETPDEKTIIFHLPAAQSDFPFAVSMGQTVPIRRDLDAKPDDLNVNGLGDMATGPYKIGTHEVDRTLTLVKNPNWDPKSDPIRHQYVDQIHFQFGVKAKQETDQLKADTDPNSAAYYSGIDTDQVQAIMADPNLKKRTIDNETGAVQMFDINVARVKDLEVRKALAMAFPKQDAITTQGGPFFGNVATTLSPRTSVGYSPQPNPYGVGDNGDPEKAKQVLTAAGKLGYEVNVAWESTPTADRWGTPIKRALEAAGFKVNLNALQDKGYYNAIRHLSNPYDLIWYQWAPDWPTNRTVYSALWYGGAAIEGGNNISQLKEPKVDDAINQVQSIQDITEQGKQYIPLDQMIQKDYAAAIPMVYTRKQIMYGSKVGGARMDYLGVCLDLFNVYLKK
ncbi:ABC transporter substrate-binding protein [Nocardia pseudobrasiliensis]|uniref:Peptide/nickel transport system substrate-binding protein n=1 Tax=Nocardia pseudobrasiliensis TaxID=45979 RepID=A0A370IBI1_9NOCA|nr:ABC transporter substrate-binding protein [Nocardia pseudobrasiliensis]RDI67970.1 peptide/nickel transport system substrate-binding protein [Nocardia pseudobrasiliensis]